MARTSVTQDDCLQQRRLPEIIHMVNIDICVE